MNTNAQRIRFAYRRVEHVGRLVTLYRHRPHDRTGRPVDGTRTHWVRSRKTSRRNLRQFRADERAGLLMSMDRIEATA